MEIVPLYVGAKVFLFLLKNETQKNNKKQHN